MDCGAGQTSASAQKHARPARPLRTPHLGLQPACCNGRATGQSDPLQPPPRASGRPCGAPARLRDRQHDGHARGVQPRRVRGVIVELELGVTIGVALRDLYQRDARVRQRRLRARRRAWSPCAAPPPPPPPTPLHHTSARARRSGNHNVHWSTLSPHTLSITVAHPLYIAGPDPLRTSLCWAGRSRFERSQGRSVPAKTSRHPSCRATLVCRGRARLDRDGERVQDAAVGAEHQAVDAEHPAALARDDAQRGQVQAAAWRAGAAGGDAPPLTAPPEAHCLCCTAALATCWPACRSLDFPPPC